jgi:hypothetical protein
MSPLDGWLKERGLSRSELAIAAGVSRALTYNACNGTDPLGGALRDYLDETAPGLSARQDAWRGRLAGKVRRRATTEPA